MKAFIIDRYGSGARLGAGEVPDPVMREDDVLVQVHAAGVNQLDCKIRSGEFKQLLPYRLPLILGNDEVGVVLKVGARVRRFKPGDEVCARPDPDRIRADLSRCRARRAVPVSRSVPEARHPVPGGVMPVAHF